MLKLAVVKKPKGFVVASESNIFAAGDSGNSIRIAVELKSISSVNAKYGGTIDLSDYLVDSLTLEPLIDSEGTLYLEES